MPDGKQSDRKDFLAVFQSERVTSLLHRVLCISKLTQGTATDSVNTKFYLRKQIGIMKAQFTRPNEKFILLSSYLLSNKHFLEKK